MLRAAAKYGRAVAHAETMAKHIATVAPRHEIELSVDETCDAESQELYELYAAVCSHKTDSVKDGIYDMTLSPHIMYISSIELLPEYRGQNLGGILARFVAHVLGAGYSVFLKPYPLNCYDLDKGRVDKIVDKLRRSYRRAGFESIRKSGYMLLPKCRAVLLP